MAVMMGLEKQKAAASTGVPAVYTMKTENGDPVGIGFVQSLIVDGSKFSRAIWVHKVTMRQNSENATTKEDTMNWQAPTVQGKGWPVMLDASGEDQIRDFSEFTDEADAIAWLKAKAGIS